MITNNSGYLLLFNGAVLLVCAVFDFAQRDTLLVALMLFLPFIDRQWNVPKLKSYNYQRILWIVLTGTLSLVLVVNPDKLNFILATVLLVALPEEWFFRVYFMLRTESISGNNWVANITTSTLFAIMHVPTQGVYGLAVFVPSIILGWLYQQHRDLVLVVLLHALSNLVYLLYLREVFSYE